MLFSIDYFSSVTYFPFYLSLSPFFLFFSSSFLFLHSSFISLLSVFSHFLSPSFLIFSLIYAFHLFSFVFFPSLSPTLFFLIFFISPPFSINILSSLFLILLPLHLPSFLLLLLLLLLHLHLLPIHLSPFFLSPPPLSFTPSTFYSITNDLSFFTHAIPHSLLTKMRFSSGQHCTYF
ncbi:unnamed protein product [Acanthosepion pharaonis]|uniref:Uncharacterized protein n=1 Tax=Acanthosepion pharaonis TaxID=158019 RepID=A0A812E5G0_ACAPH|nr:unnamed protein product [Sepia pharaonis]